MRPHPYASAARLPALEAGELCDLGALLPGPGAVELEVGPGRGGFLFERLRAVEARLIGFEVRKKWAAIVDEKLATAGLAGRARVFAEDARQALPRLASATLDRVFVHFPDPWWKKRHHKRLVVSREFLAEVSRVLKPTGELFIQTDVPERAEAYAELLREHRDFEPCSATGFSETNPFGARSPRERRAELDGLPVYRLWFRRREGP